MSENVFCKVIGRLKNKAIPLVEIDVTDEKRRTCLNFLQLFVRAKVFYDVIVSLGKKG